MKRAARALLRSLAPQFLLDKRREYLLLRRLKSELDLRNGGSHEETSITMRGDHAACDEAEVLFHAMLKTLGSDPGDLGRILEIEGMSGRKYRQLVNEIIASTIDPRYLEIGSWAGSTACAAIHGNRLQATCIDNWSEFGNAKEAFFSNVNASLHSGVDFSFIESDFRRVDYRDIGTYNVYLFDGPHRESDHYDGIRMAQPALADTHVLIVDDWNWSGVRLGSLRGLADEGLGILFSIEIRTTRDDSLPLSVEGKATDWHNGYFVAVCRKRGVTSADLRPQP